MKSLLPVIEINGSTGEGGGQILRTSITLAAVLGKSIRISKIRAGRKEPGLRPQHLQAMLAAAKIGGGTVKGAYVGSTEIEFESGRLPEKFSGTIDTRTAGSISLIAQTILPVSIFGGVSLDVKIVGGTEVPNSPTLDYLSRIVLPVYAKLGAKVELKMNQRGYYPRGGGSVRVNCEPRKNPRPIEILGDEKLSANIFSVSSLLPRHIAERQADSAAKLLEKNSAKIGIVQVETGSAASPGSSLLIYETDANSKFVGASSLGEKGKRAESVAEEAARDFLKESPDASVDSHLADMLVTLCACLPGKSVYRAPFLTEHFSTNCLVAEKLSGCKIKTEKIGGVFRVEIIGREPEKPN